MGMEHHRINSPEDIQPEDIRQMLAEARRNHDPDLLQQARATFREARGQTPENPLWHDVAAYGRTVAATIEDPERLQWIPTSDDLGLIAAIDEDDYLVVHPQRQWWRAGAAWPHGPQPTFWSPEKFTTKQSAVKAAGHVTIPPPPE